MAHPHTVNDTPGAPAYQARSASPRNPTTPGDLPAVSVIGLGIVLILLLPRIDELINKLASLSPTSALVERLRNFVGGADQTTVAIYAVSIGLAILVLAKLSVPLPRPRSVLTWFRRPTLPRRRRNFGYSTKHDVIVTRGRSGEDSPDDQD
jgi:hypothetical protein